MKRISPIRLSGTIVRSARINGFEAVLAYGEEDRARTWVADLSHIPKYDLQGPDLSFKGIRIPGTPGACAWHNRLLTACPAPGQGLVWDFGMPPDDGPDDMYITDVTDARFILALAGKNLTPILERLSPLDLRTKDTHRPRIRQGPFSQVACQIVSAGKGMDTNLFFIAGTRGYGPDMARAIFQTGRQGDLAPCGMERILAAAGV